MKAKLRAVSALVALLALMVTFASVALPAKPAGAITIGCDMLAVLDNFGPDGGVTYAHKLSGDLYSASLRLQTYLIYALIY